MPVYGFSDANCKHEVYTTQEVLSLLQQTIDKGSLAGINPNESPIVALIRESRVNRNLSFWVGTEAQFNALSPQPSASLVMARIGENGKIYLCTDDTTLSDFQQKTIDAAREAAEEVTNAIISIRPQIIVTADDGCTITCSNGATDITPSGGSGKWICEIPAFGAWTVTANNGSQQAAKTVTVDAVKQYRITLDFSADFDELQSYLSAPNILDNWYMANPINQRGNTTYSGAYGNMIDRWKQYGGAGTTTVETGYIKLANTGASISGIYQNIENERLISGETYTFSCLAKVTAGNVTETRAPWALSWCNDLSGTIKGASDLAGLHTGVWWLYTLTFAAEESEMYSFRLSCKQEGGEVLVKAFKLERGTKSTLAYFGKDGEYHLMDSPPKVADELLRCQRYYYKNPKLYITGFLSAGSTEYLIPIKLPIAMRACPEIVGAPTWRGRIAAGGYSAHTGTEFVEFTNASIIDFSGDTITLHEVLSASAGDTNNSILSYDLRNIELSAEL